ncbi:hypothetical protein [Pseudooctadecabacter sp.]|uniref:hypothetical protein n=1 Tax=Pseudooctadecabacter sp. TaxID=1966338 RepID=UPI0035C79E8E
MDLTVHIGAHRTGSTLVAQAITQSVADYPDCGVAVWHPRHLRAMGGWQAVPRSLKPGGAPTSKTAARILDGLKAQLDGDAQAEAARGVRHLVISEENLMGTMRTNMGHGVFYPDVARRLRAYDMVLPKTPTRVALGVRDYGSVWSSAFHYIPQAGKEPPSRDGARAALLGSDRGWTDIIAEVYSVWPDVEIYVWQQEDLEDHAAFICAGLLEVPEDKITLPDARVNRLEASQGRRPLFDAKERALLTQRYRDHLSALHGSIATPNHEAAE